MSFSFDLQQKEYFPCQKGNGLCGVVQMSKERRKLKHCPITLTQYNPLHALTYSTKPS